MCVARWRRMLGEKRRKKYVTRNHRRFYRTSTNVDYYPLSLHRWHCKAEVTTSILCLHIRISIHIHICMRRCHFGDSREKRKLDDLHRIASNIHSSHSLHQPPWPLACDMKMCVTGIYLEDIFRIIYKNKYQTKLWGEERGREKSTRVLPASRSFTYA